VSFRQFLYRQLEPTAYAGPGLSPTNRAVAVLILAGATLAILDTEQAIRNQAELVFWILEYSFVALFSVEYVARVYAAGENPAYAGLIGRIRYLKTPAAVIDLMAIAPFLLTAGGYNTFLLRLLKLIRLLWPLSGTAVVPPGVVPGLRRVPLHHLHDAQQVATPDLLDVLVAVASAHQLQRHVEVSPA
jgi:hypothetical protein